MQASLPDGWFSWSRVLDRLPQWLINALVLSPAAVVAVSLVSRRLRRRRSPACSPRSPCCLAVIVTVTFGNGYEDSAKQMHLVSRWCSASGSCSPRRPAGAAPRALRIAPQTQASLGRRRAARPAVPHFEQLLQRLLRRPAGKVLADVLDAAADNRFHSGLVRIGALDGPRELLRVAGTSTSSPGTRWHALDRRRRRHHRHAVAHRQVDLALHPGAVAPAERSTAGSR